MVFWIVLSVLVIAFLIYVGYFIASSRKNGGFNWSKFGEHSFIAAIAGVMIISITFFIAFLSGSYVVVGEQKSPLKALSTGTQTEGSFFIGSGTIEGKEVIKYISQNEQGGWSINKIGVEGALIFEDEEDAPYVSQKIKQFVVNPIFLPFDGNGEKYVSNEGYNFHIPKNSIIEDYGVNINE